MRILVNGISGFIGGSFGRYAMHAGCVVMGTGRMSQPPRGWAGFYTSIATTADITSIIRDFSPDVLLNAAGTASVRASLDDPLSDFRGSVQTCVDVLDAVRVSGHDPLVVIPSSAAVYGNPAVLPVNEEAALQPISPYGFNKAGCELVAREYAECFALRVVVCRFFSVFGQAQRRLLVWELYQQLASVENTVWLDGTGDETRDFLYIDDLTSAVLGLVERFQNQDPESLIINVASGIETNVATIAETFRDLVAPEKKIQCRGNARTSDPMRWWADISRLQALLPSWQPRPLKAGLASCFTDWQKTDPSTE